MDTINSDVVVIGAGLAGFTAAVCAAEAGASVLLIDKSAGEFGDGNVLMASGSLRAGGKSPKTNPDELYDFVMSEGVGLSGLGQSLGEYLRKSGRLVDQCRRKARRDRPRKNLVGSKERNLPRSRL